jgi:cytochrome P450 family 9
MFQTISFKNPAVISKVFTLQYYTVLLINFIQKQLLIIFFDDLVCHSKFTSVHRKKLFEEDVSNTLFSHCVADLQVVHTFDHHEKLEIPFEKPIPLFGNMLNLVLKKQSLVAITQNSYDNFKKSKPNQFGLLIEFNRIFILRIFGFFNFKKPAFFVTDIELIKKITIKNFDHFLSHDLFANADRIMDRSLFFLSDQKWKNMRSTLSPIFTSSKMKMMYGLLSDHAQDFVNYFESKLNNVGVLVLDVLDIFSRFTADAICTTVLGFEGDCVRNKDSHILKIVKNLLNECTSPIANMKFLFVMMLPKVYAFFNIQCISPETYNFFRSVTIDVMNERDRKKISRHDVIQLLLQAKKGQLQNSDKDNEVIDKELTNFAANIEYDVSSKQKLDLQFDDEDWIGQTLVFFMAGFHTTSTLLQMVAYELAQNTEIQRELQEEIDSNLLTNQGKPIGYEAIHKMKFLDMVVSETLRKWPPVPTTDRKCTTDFELDLENGKLITIKAGETFTIPIYQIQHDPEHFLDPEKFDPYRFSDENKDAIKSGTFLTFGLGPRVCIGFFVTFRLKQLRFIIFFFPGSRFALMEAKLLLFNLLSKFTVENCDATPKVITFTADMNRRVKEQIFLNFKFQTISKK